MKIKKILSLLLVLATLLGVIGLASCDDLFSFIEDGDINLPLGDRWTDNNSGGNDKQSSVSLDNIPAFDGKNAYVDINGGVPFFNEEDYTTESYETYGELDTLGRCTVTMACIGVDLMPTDGRETIANVYPTGWKYNGKSNNKEYSGIVEADWVYNRSHLIGYQLTGENDNKQNLITGTRYFNVTGMLPFENMVADYVKETKNHVLYRVTPIFDGDNLLADGVLMEAMSMEDNGEEICFCVFVYNVQPGIEFNYATGENWLAD